MNRPLKESGASEDPAPHFSKTYLNPVYPQSFPDPYVLKFCGEYFAYCSGFGSDGNAFGVLRSRDLISWHPAGGAMAPLKNGPPFYWAPEVTYHNGKFYLYYSVGNEALMEIRVAVSERPDGGFIDSGKRLTSEEFAIDAHIFRDDDGKRYMFYATDFLKHTHIGTGVVVDEMTGWDTLAGDPRPVVRAEFDWQVYDPQRQEKGGVRWHTVEGPFVLKRKGIYYLMFSGGNWQNVSYGVSFAVTGDIGRSEEWRQFCDGEKVLPILRTIPGRITGPGHNSVARGLNNRESYCVYHRWVEDARVMAIDRMDIAGERIFVHGPTYTPQIAPYLPALTGFFEAQDLNDDWETTGEWNLSRSQATSEISGAGELAYRNAGERFLFEVSLSVPEAPDENSRCGFYLKGKAGKTVEFLLFPNKKRGEITRYENGKENRQDLALPEDFNFDAFHLLRVEVDGFWVKISLDEDTLFANDLQSFSSEVILCAANVKAAFAGFALTKGFEDLFDRQGAGPEQFGWKNVAGNDGEIKDRQLFLSSDHGKETALFKEGLYKDHEFSANVRLVESGEEGPAFGFLLLDEELKPAARISIQREGERWYVSAGGDGQKHYFPEDLSLLSYRQFRLLRIAGRLFFYIEDTFLGEALVPEGQFGAALFCRDSTIAFDMVRVTAF